MVKAEIRASIDMKDSGLDWIEYIPKEWKVMPLKRYFQFGKGLPITKADLTETGAKVINYGQIHAKYNTGVAVDDRLVRYVPRDYLATNPVSLCSKGDIIMADTSEDKEGCGNAVYINCDEGIFAGYHTIILKSAEDNKYLAYLFQSDAWRSQIRTRVNGVKLYSITQRILSQCNIVLPPLAEQRAIAAYLDKVCGTIDEIMAEAKDSIEEYKQLRESVISEATTRGIRKNRSMKASGIDWLPEIPADWDIIPAKVLFAQGNERKHENDVQLTASQKHGIISQAEYMERENSRIVIATQGIENWKHVEPNDFIISLRSFQGGLEKSDVSGCITWHYVVLKARTMICYDYFKWLFKSAKYINALQGTCNFIRDGQDLRFSNFIQVPLLNVPFDEQKEIADYLNNEIPKIDSLVAEKQALISDLAAYKKSLIYELVTGKRRVV